MRWKYSGLILLVIVTLLVAACGTEGVMPTPPDKTESEDSPTSAPAQVNEAPTEAEVDDAPTVAEVEETVEEMVASGDLLVDGDDWHVLGSPDAPVTIVEYSDFQ
jgi:protein-disulfide isomerase